jgi:hypothetical protein
MLTTLLFYLSQQTIFKLLVAYNKSYSDNWKLTVNTSKTKVLVFLKGRRMQYSFTYGNENLEVVEEFKYLGVLFSRSGSFLKAKTYIANQAIKALYCFIEK